MSFEKIIKSRAPILEEPKGNFVNTVFKDVQKWWMKPALESSESRVIYTYFELMDKIKQWSGFLKSFGLTSEDSIMIISPSCLQYVPIFYGTISLGIPIATVDPSLTSNEIKQKIFHIGSKFIVYSKEVENVLSQALKEDNSEFQLFCIGKPMKLKALNADDILCGKKYISSLWPTQVNGEETALISFSSGTTGTPKAVEISHNALSMNLYSLNNPYHNITWKPEDLDQSIFMGMNPFSHIIGILLDLSSAFFCGNKTVIFPKYSPDVFIDGISKHKITRIFGTPSILNLMTDSSKCTKETAKTVDTLICGAAPLLKSSVEAFRKKYESNIDLIELYGMSEVLGAFMMPRSYKNLLGCGRLLSNVNAKIICTETGEILGPNQSGEICIKSPSVMKGYLNNQKATDDILKNGWIHTGDIGYYDEEEFFFLTDRIKDLINVDGWQVSPSEVESELQKHPLVEECCVIGKPDPKYGELPFAFVVSKKEVSEEELQNFLKDKLAEFKQLRGGIKFVESFPKTAILKIDKKKLRTMIM